MPDPITLSTDGPHSPEYTRQVANILAEAVRVLTYATRAEAPGLDYPGDANGLLGSLAAAFQRVPQLAAQITGFLAAQRDTGTLADDHGRDVTEQVALGAFNLGEAHHAGAVLAAAFQGAQNAISGLYVKDGTEGEAPDGAVTPGRRPGPSPPP